jgi:hypothetical protein
VWLCQLTVGPLAKKRIFKFNISFDPRSFCFHLFVFRNHNSGSCARRVLAIVYIKSLLSDKNRTLFTLSFCLDTKERKNQVSIEAVRRKFLSDRYSKRVYALAYKRQALFGIGAASKFSSPSLRQSRRRSAEPF